MNQLLLQYSYLQVLDFMTTVAFLLHGIREGNPLVRFALNYAPHPMTGLIVVKVAALGLGIYCWRCGRNRLLSRINLLFALVVAWNMVALIVAASKLNVF
ncbi:MAG TPA: DUF5658 family protein [Bryobacteraceae bacterium]|nr:DUF5658 family protein [Bryobacteraceae bacterium]